MKKRTAETQLTKDQMSSSFNFSAGGGGGREDSMEPSKIANPDVLANRKIAPLKRRGAPGKGTSTRSGGAGASLPNVFAGAGQGVVFGSAATNGSTTPSFGSGFGSAPTPPIQTSFGNGPSGSFSFGHAQQQPEQPKPNPFAGLAPTNGTSGGIFGNSNSGSFDSSNAVPANGIFGNGNASTASTPVTSFSGFGTSTNDKSATAGFNFGGSNTTTAAPTTSGMFGNATSMPTGSFTFKAVPTPNEEPKPIASGFSFGQPTATSTAEPPKATTPSFSFSTPFGAAPVSSTTSSAATGFGSGLATDAVDGKKSGFSFGTSTESKVPETSAGSMFAKLGTAQAAGFSFGQQPKEATSTSLFGKPAEPTKSMFGFGEKKGDNQQLLFGAAPGRVEEATEPTPMFSGFAAANEIARKEELAKPLFGLGATEKKDGSSMFGGSATSTEKEAKSMFRAADSTSGFSFGVQKPVENIGPKFNIGAPMFGPKPTDAKPTAPPKPISFPAAPFGVPSSAAATASQVPAMAGVTPSVSNSVSTLRMRSPPLSTESYQWSANQLTDYYNLFALRSLNHCFKEELAKQDIFADLTTLCEAYSAEIKKIRGLMESNQRYKFGETTLGSTVSGKRAGDDNDERGGKRRALGEESKVTFASPKSSSSQALASVLGGGSSTKPLDELPKSTDRYSPKSASIFDNPSSVLSPSAWVNPFQKADTSNLPDDSEQNYDDESAPASHTRSLFDRITPPNDPVPEPKPNRFDQIAPPISDEPLSAGMFSAGGDQTWTPEKGVKFSAPSGSGLFTGSNNGGLFSGSNGTAPSSGFSFGSTVNIASPSIVSSAEASEPETGTTDEAEPSDSQPPTKQETDLSKQGPGEEDEDSLFQVRSIVYDMTNGTAKKEGVGTLRVLKNRTNGKARIIVRSDIGKVVMNVALSRDIKYMLQDKRLLRVPEFLEGGGIKTWGTRIGKEGPAEDLKIIVEEAKNGC